MTCRPHILIVFQKGFHNHMICRVTFVKQLGMVRIFILVAICTNSSNVTRLVMIYRKDEAFLDTVQSWSDFEAASEAQEIELMKRFKKRSDFIHSTDISQPLKRWLTNNVEAARGKMAKSESTRLELERRQDELCNDMSMTDIRWDDDSGWETMHRY